MWPSVETASLLYNLANIGLVLGLIIGVVSTIVLVRMGNVKETYLNKDLADSRERTASLEKQSAESKMAIAKANADAAQSLATAKLAEANLADANLKAAEAQLAAEKAKAQSEEAKAESAKSFERATEAQKSLAEANERAAQAEQKAAEAKLDLEKFKAPRILSEKEQQLIISRINKFAGQEYRITTFWDLKEPLNFSNQLHRTLQLAGWKYIHPGPGGSFLLGGLGGIQIYIHPEADTFAKDSVDALITALEEIGQAPKLKLQNSKNEKTNKIAINVGTKQ